ncbi:MAG: carboxypeptidase regulatory-like domain-containing protein [Bryobacteraceae bacterium]
MSCLLPVWASLGGSVSGTVTDPVGLAVAGASVTAINTATNVRQTVTTNSVGVYSFPELAVGTYLIEVEATSFRTYRHTNLVVDTDSKLLVDARLALGDQGETVTVAAAALSVDTAKTQLGDVIDGAMIVAVPLNGRSFTDLLALQPGVAPTTTITGNSIQAAGAAILSPSGDLNPGTMSINGQREYANGFTVNDSDVVERFTMGAAIIPNLDSIAEFRVLTGNFEAQYGNYAGGRINVITKAGTNQFHAEAFEFLRNTDFDARNFFSPERGVFQQNQVGGLFGGPIVKSKVFFYADYQGTRLNEGVDTGLISLPSLLNRQGNFSDVTSQMTGTVSGQYWANQLAGELGYAVSPGEPYYTPGCGSSSQCVFPGAIIPRQIWSSPAQKLLQYIPTPNLPNNYFSTSSIDETLADDKAAMRMDASTRLGMLSGYYFADNYTQSNPYPTLQGGANVPGFGALNLGRSQLATIGLTTSLGPSTVNEFHVSYVRAVNDVGTPQGTVGTSLASQGFVSPSGQPSILPQRPNIVGVENVTFNDFVIGSTVTGLNQTDNTFEYRDNFSHIVGTHTFMTGGELMFSQVNSSADIQSNGTFAFTGSETGIDFADFLLGAPSFYKQGDAQAFFMRNRYGSLFAQDSWRIRPRLTLNYGLRWDAIMPWYEKYNQIQTLVPGEQSVVYPGAPTGLAFPGDPGVSRALAPVRWNDFSPRFGLAWAPHGDKGFARWLFGDSDKTSIRVGFGRFFSAIEGVSAGVMAGDAPYGSTYISPAPPLFTDPFVTASTGFNNGQRFPLQYPPLNATASNPDPNVNWANFLPISGLPGYKPDGVTPYTEQYTLSIQRQFKNSTVVTASYVGSESHHLLTLVEANPGNPALCLSLSQVSQVAPGSPTCGPFGESNVFTTPSGQVINGTRAPFGPNFGSVDWLTTIGNANYNALQLSVRHTGKRLELSAGYTYSKSLDNSSSISEQLNPYNYGATYAPSAFDLKHNFVGSYRYELPFDELFHARNRLTQGWILSGITRFSTGFPVTFTNAADTSLLGTQPDGVNAYGVDLPNMVPGPFDINHNPRNGQPYFNTSLFSLPPLGSPGTAPRRLFYGPGIENFDIALSKDIRLGESSSLQLRMETFNTFNHAQFFGPASVNGEITSPAFGQVVSADSPRLVQLAAKIRF